MPSAGTSNANIWQTTYFTDTIFILICINSIIQGLLINPVQMCLFDSIFHLEYYVSSSLVSYHG